MAKSAAERQREYRERAKKALRRATSRKRNDEPAEFRNKDTVLELLESLPRVQANHDGPYTFQDRARDFIEVLGSTEAGRRVFAQIAQICDPATTIADFDKPGTLAGKAGMRRVMAEIMLCFVVKEPVRIERSRDGEVSDAQ